MDHEGPLFSIIIPTHNRSKLLKEAVQSVIDQVFQDWECIIIDDGSVDDTKTVVEEFNDQRIKYFYQNHSERSTARNLGVLKAGGKYICFLDDDDVFKLNHLSILSFSIVKNKSPTAIFRTNMVICKNGIEEKTNKAPFPLTDPIRYFLDNMVGIHTLCFHRDILSEYKFDERWWHFQDTHLLVRVLVEYPIFIVPEYTAVYNVTEDSGSRRIFKSQDINERLNNNLGAIEDLFTKLPEAIINKLGKNTRATIISKKYLDYASGCIHSKKKMKGLKLILEAVKKYPLILQSTYFIKTVFQFFKF